MRNVAPFVRRTSANKPALSAGGRISWPLAGMVLVNLVVMLCLAPRSSGQPPGVLTNLAQVHAVPLKDSTNGYPVALRATITYVDPDWRMVFLQDETGSAYLARSAPSGDPSWNLLPGQVVDLEGITSPGIIQCNVAESALHPVAQGPLPKPWRLESEESFKNIDDARWIRVGGVITEVKTLGRKLDLEFRVNQGRALRLMVAQGNPVSAATLLGSLAEVTGVYGLDLDASNRPTGRNVIWISDLAGIQNTHALPITPIGELAASAQMKRVRGNVLSQSPGDFLVIRDDSGSLRVNYKGAIRFGVGSPAEFFGYVAGQGSALVLNDAMVLMPVPPGAPETLSEANTPKAANKSLPMLRQVAQVRNLPASEAVRGYPVRVRGVLTYIDPHNSIQFIQDSSGGIFVDSKLKKFESLPEALQLVEITGFTGPGAYAPVIEVEQFRVLGDAELPKPKSATMQVLMTGAEDSQWIVLNGVIRSQKVEEERTILSLATGNSVVDVIVPKATDHPAPRDLVDAWVEVRGVVGTVFDNQRHLQSVRLFVPNWDEIRTWTVGVDDPFALPVQSLGKLLEFHAGDEGIHRAHVRGTVLLRQTDGSFYLQDATGGILVQMQKTPNLVKAGQVLEVVGFPSIVNRWPVLQESTVRPATEISTLQPTSLLPETLLSQVLNGTLVRLQARVIGHSSSATEDSLKLQFGPWITDAILEKSQPDEKLAGIDSGSTVELSGVYLARLDDNMNVQSFQLMLRSPNDIKILERPSWWTARRLFWSVGTLLLAFVVVLAWVSLLHNQVNARTRELRSEIEERKRMESQVAATHRELLIASRGAGMAEVATSVLHNVGNVLNSVNVSANLIVEVTKDSHLSGLARVSALVREHADDLPAFLTQDPNGRELPKYLELLTERHQAGQKTVLAELESLTKNINHIKDIVTRQQSYAKAIGVVEVVKVSNLIDDALQMNRGALARHNVTVMLDLPPDLPQVTIDKHKVLQILVNLISNAKYACHESKQPDKRLIVRADQNGNRVRISVEDNGVGIAPENATRIFDHGFTTRAHGHGYGLHSGALAAKELGGTLLVHSEGPGRGATFTLELPLQPSRAAV